MTVLGLLADTHIPDRVPTLHPKILQVFREQKVQAILHAGDVSIPQVLDELKQVAPVYAVKGNRDIFYLRHLPLQVRLEVDGFSIAMAHGHGTFKRYMVDKVDRAVRGRMDVRYVTRMLDTFPDADVIVFGHLHVVYNVHLEGKLVINPGSTSYPWPRGSPPTFGLLFLEPGQAPQAEILTIP